MMLYVRNTEAGSPAAGASIDETLSSHFELIVTTSNPTSFCKDARHDVLISGVTCLNHISLPFPSRV